MIEQICAFIHNYFYGDRHGGEFKIENNTLNVDGLVSGQFIRICGSRFNDGVIRYQVDELTDETFWGVVWEMYPPRAFLALVGEIEAWQEKYGEATSGPYQSESFGGYSYTLKSGSNAAGQTDQNASSWRGVFRSQLNRWRKLYEPDN